MAALTTAPAIFRSKPSPRATAARWSRDWPGWASLPHSAGVTPAHPAAGLEPVAALDDVGFEAGKLAGAFGVEGLLAAVPLIDPHDLVLQLQQDAADAG